MNPLNGAYKRVNRASKHLSDLKRGIKVFRQYKIDSISVDYQRIRNHIKHESIYIRNVRSRPIPVPQEFSILVGEIIYNLRAALDYLVYELACFDSKQEVEGTQFPIENSPETFDTRVRDIKGKRRNKKYLKGVSPEHVTAIKRLQPFNGCQWTERLRDISNPDKHRRLTVVDSPIVVGSEVDSAEALLANQSVNVKDIFSFEVIFRDGMPVIETLEQLILKVVETLDSFKPEFKRR